MNHFTTSGDVLVDNVVVLIRGCELVWLCGCLLFSCMVVLFCDTVVVWLCYFAMVRLCGCTVL